MSSSVVYNDGSPPVSRPRFNTPEMGARLLPTLPHPYSAAALEARFNSPIHSHASRDFKLTTSTISKELADFNSLPTIQSLRHKTLPPLPSTSIAENSQKGHSSLTSKSKARPISQTTQASKRSKRLVRPIIPKAELARQFDVNEQTPSPLNDLGQNALPAPPHVNTHRRSEPLLSSSSLLQHPPAIIAKESHRRHSDATAATGITIQTGVSQGVSLYYGSDIIRPSSGRKAHDRMRHSDVDGPLQTLPSASIGEQSPMTQEQSKSITHGSWNSDHTIDTYISVFNGGWPIPPLSLPSSYEQSKPHRRRKEGSKPSASTTRNVPKQRGSSSANNEANTNTERGQISSSSSPSPSPPQRPRPVRGPRMEFPLPRSKPRTENATIS